MHSKSILLISAGLAVTLLTGCAAAPSHKDMSLPQATGYAPDTAQAIRLTPVEGEVAQRFVPGKDIQADWWTLFQSPELNALIGQALAANPDIDQAKAALTIAQENVYAQKGFFFPTVQAGYTPSRTMVAGNQGGNAPGLQGDGKVIEGHQGTPANEGGKAPFNSPVTYNYHTAQLTVGFVPDVFSVNRHQVESLQAQTKIQYIQLQAAYITLASNVAAAAFQDALLRRQIAITEDLIRSHVDVSDLVRRQVAGGYASKLDLAVQENALAQARQLLPPLQKQFEQNCDLLKTLAGITQDQAVPAFDLDQFRLPEELPLTLPSQLVEQRPDVQAAKAQLHAASALAGAARAARLPQFSIDANIGGTAGRFDQMFWKSGQFFDLALNIVQPVIDGGTRKHQESAANAATRQAAAQYRSTVLTAFQDVADTLHAIRTDTEALQASRDVTQTAQTVRDLTVRQHQSGYLDRLALIAAEQNYLQAQLDLAQAQASRLGD